MIYVFLASFSKERLPAGAADSILKLIVLPNDLDINLHVNNGRYLTLCDLTRIDMFIRTGLAKVMIKKGWIPIVAEHTMTYRKPLKVFQRFELKGSLTHWDEKFFYMTHTFTRDGIIVAEGTSKGTIRARAGVVPPAGVIEAVKSSRQMG
jgi:acyl-CoA thioesterase FadM